MGQLLAILHKDPGLMVELKRWVPKDATDHGQLISDADLTDEAIFDRLENDIPFRSVATNLVRKYGYLQPAINPDSPLAKEQDLIMQERAKWVAQDAEAERTKARQLEQQQDLYQTQYCDPRVRNCPVQSYGNNAPIQQYPQQQPGSNPLPSDVPGLQNPITIPPTVPYAPPQRTAPSNDVTDLLRTNGEDPLAEQQQPGGGFGGSSQYGQNSEGRMKSIAAKLRHLDAIATSGDGLRLVMDSDFAGDASSQGMCSNSGVREFQNQWRESSYNEVLRLRKQDVALTIPTVTALMNARRAREAVSPVSGFETPESYRRYRRCTRICKRRHPPADRAVRDAGIRRWHARPADDSMDLPVGPNYVLGPGMVLRSAAGRSFAAVLSCGRSRGPAGLPDRTAAGGGEIARQCGNRCRRPCVPSSGCSPDVSLSRLRVIRVYVIGDGATGRL